MAPHVREGTSIQAVVEMVDAVAGGLEADPLTASLAPTWATMVARGDDLSAMLTAARRASRRAGQRLFVVDKRWDETIAAFGRHVLDLAGGARDAQPYTRFFHALRPSDAQKVGPARALATGDEWLLEIDREPSSALATEWKPRIVLVQDALRVAHGGRGDALRAEGPIVTAVRLYVDDLNHEIDRLEGDLLRIFAGRRERAAAFFEPFRPARRAGEPEDPPPAD